MRKQKWLLFLAIMSVLALLAACGGGNENTSNNGQNDNGKNGNNKETADAENDDNVNETDMPIVDDAFDMTIFANKPAQNEDNDWNDILIWNEYRDMTNINVEWDLQNPDALDEKRNLALGSNELPDVFFLSEMSNADLLKYGSQESFVPLNDLIDEYAPNLTELMEEDPSIRKAITFPDGNIYSMPALIEEDFLSLRLSARPWINNDWLEELDMDMPETTDEFYEYLKAVKELDPAGNGDTVPYGGTIVDELVQWLSGSFGVMNTGYINENIDADPDDPSKVRFYAVEDDYKKELEYIHKLYDEGLIDENIFTIEWGQFLSNASENQYASMTFYDPIDLFGEEVGEQYDSLAALEGPDGYQDYHKVAPSVWDTANYIVTSENENPEAAVRWMDYFYGEEGAKLYYMGLEGETYEENDGEIEYMDHITDPDDDMTFEQAVVQQLTWVGSISGIIKGDYFAGGESEPQSMEAAEKIDSYVPEEIWSRFTYTADENKVLESTGQDVNKYVEEMRDKFITGDMDLDSDWDDYVETIEKMGGLDELMDVYQNAYDRYQES